ncbi:MAG: electron transfer flavoprotein subunit alpha/FixB family protein [Nocardioidaceae bacterium]
MSEVLVLVDKAPQVDGGVRKASLELLTLARRIGEPSAVVFGGADDAVVATLGSYGAAKVYAVAGDDADQFLSLPKAEALVDIAQRVSPAAVLVTSGPEGKDVAARVAVRLDAGIITDATDLVAGDGGVTAKQSVFSGTWVATSQVTRGAAVVTVRPNSLTPETSPATPTVETVEVALSDAARGARVTERSPRQSSGRPALTDAAVVVTGGRGVGSPEGFEVIGRVADALSGAVGATRAVTDLDWADHDLQVGQTGKTVAPNLYLAAGVSGAIQHRAGMQSSKTVVAVNKDAKAPIFEVSDFGVVGDLHAVLPALLDEISRRRG